MGMRAQLLTGIAIAFAGGALAIHDIVPGVALIVAGAAIYFDGVSWDIPS